jgi:uncharacterized protein YndB with AHSA1/START domain
MLQTNYTQVGDKQLKVEREFNAALAQVWKAWTDSAILDQWWAPLPFKAVTQKMDFREGGQWFYYMQGPNGERHYCTVTYDTIVPERSFAGDDGFCDENGKLNTDFPVMKWDVRFAKAGERTKVEILVSFDSEEDLKKIVEMGFKEGFEAAHGNLDKVLAGETVAA